MEKAHRIISVLLLFVEWLGVNRYAKDLRKHFLYAIFQHGRDVMDLRNGELAFHGAVAGHQNVVLYLACAHVVAIY
jgi:hypothetical protein